MMGTVAHLTRYRTGILNQLEFGTNFEYVTDLHDRLESRANDIYVRAASRIGDEITARVVNNYENVPAPFFLPHNVPMLRGRLRAGTRSHAGAHVRRTRGPAGRRGDLLQLLQWELGADPRAARVPAEPDLRIHPDL